MMLTLLAIAVTLGAVVFVFLRVRRRHNLQQVDALTILPEELHRLLETGEGPKLYDLRLPLNLLAYSEAIPGSIRIAPKEVQANPSLIPRDDDETIIYCTCPGDETALTILAKLKELEYNRLRILKGGLEAWKAKGYTVERYSQAFHLDTPA